MTCESTSGNAIKIKKGSTARFIFRWEQTDIVYVPIVTISKTAPIVIETDEQEMPDGWRFALTGVSGGGSVLNAKASPPKDSDYFQGRVIDPTHVSVNSVNGAGWATAGSGGILQYNRPVDLAGATAKLQVRAMASPTSPVLIELTSQNDEIVFGDGSTTAIFSSDSTKDAPWTKAVCDMDITYPDGSVMSMPTIQIIFESAVTD